MTRHFKKDSRTESQGRSAVEEAERLHQALERRAARRADNIVGIEGKFATGALTPRHQARLLHELNLLQTYDSRHLSGEPALAKHTWIKFGLNYQEVMEQRNARLPQ